MLLVQTPRKGYCMVSVSSSTSKRVARVRRIWNPLRWRWGALLVIDSSSEHFWGLAMYQPCNFRKIREVPSLSSARSREGRATALRERHTPPCIVGGTLNWLSLNVCPIVHKLPLCGRARHRHLLLI